MTNLHGWITQQVDATETEARTTLTDPTPVLRRCEADRRILTRHHRDLDSYEPSCAGCGTYGDMGLPETDNINDCPELLDLAHAHGLTPEQHATLDRPQPVPTAPTIPMPQRRRPIRANTHAVPPALRGRNWTGIAR